MQTETVSWSSAHETGVSFSSMCAGIVSTVGNSWIISSQLIQEPVSQSYQREQSQTSVGSLQATPSVAQANTLYTFEVSSQAY